jgi:hypothetical protein
MRSITICMLLLVFATTSFCQQTTPSSAYTREEYMKKSKRKKTIGFIFLGTGVAIMTYGAINALTNTDVNSLLAIPLVGIPLTITSVPFFNAAVRYKNKANAISAYLKVEQAQLLSKARINHISFPSIAIRIPL